MSTRVRLSIAAGSMLAGATLAAFFFYGGQPWASFLFLLAGAYMALATVNGIRTSSGDPRFHLFAGVIGAIGLLGTFAENRAFDLALQEAQADALAGFTSMGARCSGMSPDLQQMQSFGQRACGTQANSDQIRAVVELSKGLHLGPGLSMIDGAATLAAGNPPNYCAMIFVAAAARCPAAFTEVKWASRDALLKASGGSP